MVYGITQTNSLESPTPHTMALWSTSQDVFITEAGVIPLQEHKTAQAEEPIHRY